MSVESSSSRMLDSTDIAKVLSSTGPIVKCVLLKAPQPSADEEKPSPVIGKPLQPESTDTNDDSTKPTPRIVLRDLMEEIEIDTTPSKSKVSEVLGGGSFTFLGQYEDEGIVLMIRQLPEDLERTDLVDCKASELRHLCQEREIPIEKHMIEKSDLIESLLAWSQRSDPPYNTHVLQPPLHKARIRGDILVMKVAETKDEEDDDKGLDPSAPIEVPTNEEFFLDYTLEDYVKFASRTDIPEYELDPDDDDDDDDDDDGEEDGEEVQEEGEEEEEEHSGDEEGEEEEEHDPDADGEEEGVPLRLGDDVEIDDEDRAAMFNLVMNEVLRQYREENGRGPDTKELLEIRASIAKELDVPVAQFDAEQADWNKHAKDGTPAKENAKTIAFHTEDKVLEYQPDPNEHNYEDIEPGLGYRHLGEDDDDEQDDDDDDEYPNAKPPRKRRRIVIEDRAEIDDSKPAATESNEHGKDQTNHGDEKSGATDGTDKSTDKR